MEEKKDEEISEITQLNLNIKFFTNYLNEFSEKINIMDIDVVTSMAQLITSINDFLDSADIYKGELPIPKVLEESEDDVSLYAVYKCSICNNEQYSGSKIVDHLLSKKHRDRKTNIIKEEELIRATRALKLQNKEKKELSNSNALRDRNSILPKISTDITPKYKLINVDENQRNQNKSDNSSETSSQTKTPHTKKVEKHKSAGKQAVGDRVFTNQMRKPKKDPGKRVRELLETVDMVAYVQNKIRECKMGYQHEHSEVVVMLYQILKESFPKMIIYPFGSQLNGMGTRGSDLDVYIDLENDRYFDPDHHMYSPEGRTIMLQNLKKVEKILRSTTINKDFTFLFSVRDARVPLIRCRCEKFGFELDLTFNNGAGVENTKLIKYLFELQPICHQLAMFIKCWMKETEYMTNLSTYMLTMLVIYFLQLTDYVPSIERLQRDLQEPECISYWQTNFQMLSMEELGIKRVNHNIINAAVNFFRMYGYDFDFNKYIICPFLGKKLVLKSDFANPLKLNQSFDRYVNFYTSLEPQLRQKLKLAADTPMVVQDPFILSFNITKGMVMSERDRLIRFFRLSHDRLKIKYKTLLATVTTEDLRKS